MNVFLEYNGLMAFFKKLHLLQFLNIKRLKVSEKEILLVLLVHGIVGILGSIIFGLMPVMLEFLWDNKQMAGIIIMLLTAFQVFILNPLAGNLIDIKGTLFSLKIGILLEFTGAFALAFYGNTWGIYIFLLGVMGRWAFYMSGTFVLERTPQKNGGFWFGVREEILAISNILGLICLSWFLAREHWLILPFIMVCLDIIALSILHLIQPQKKKNKSSKFNFKKFISAFNFGKTIKLGLHFVYMNHKYPLFNIGTNLFEGFFYGSIWFLFPLHLVANLSENTGTFHLKIYEMVTIIFALFLGIISDRFDWKKLEYIAWGITIWAVWLLPFLNSYYALIFLGFFIGLANNLFTVSGYHVLALFHKDSKENGSYMSFANILKNIGFMISPAICGYLYEFYGFSAALMFVSVVITFIAIWMIYLTYKLKE